MREGLERERETKDRRVNLRKKKEETMFEPNALERLNAHRNGMNMFNGCLK